MELLLIRHGETDYNKNDLIQGVIDEPLNDTGINQAKKCRKVIKFNNPVIYSSPLIRAKTTAELMYPNRKCVITNSLKEINFGKWEGLKWSELLSHYGKELKQHQDGIDVSDVYEGESIRDLQKRIIDFFHLLESKHSYDNTVIAITHGQLIRASICYVLNLGLEYRTKFSVGNASITRFNFSKENGWKVKTINECLHLE